METPLVVIVTGPPGAGKTTLARRLADALELPLLCRDSLQETLFDTLGVGNSRDVGLASFALLFQVLETLLRAKVSCLVESPFSVVYTPADFAAVRSRCPFRAVQIVCSAPPEILLTRWKARLAAGERHPGHDDAASIDAFDPERVRRDAAPIPIDSDVILLDTADFAAIDHDALIARLRESG